MTEYDLWFDRWIKLVKDYEKNKFKKKSLHINNVKN
jgi:hypothetical protein